MNIIICDDEHETILKLTGYIKDYCNSRHLSCNISPYHDACDISDNALSDCDILFLDIYMPNSNGIELVRTKRQIIDCKIVFITTSTEHAIDAFDVNATHYLLKPFDISGVTEALDRCMKDVMSIQNSDRIIDIKTSSGIIPVSMNSINYIEISNTKATIHTDMDSIYTYTTLDNMSEILDDILFMRPNRSFIINMDFISSFHSDHVILKNNMSVSLSRKKLNELRKQYHRYLTEKVRNENI